MKDCCSKKIWIPNFTKTDPANTLSTPSHMLQSTSERLTKRKRARHQACIISVEPAGIEEGAEIQCGLYLSSRSVKIFMAVPRCNNAEIKAATMIVQTGTYGKLQRTTFSSCRHMLQTTRGISHTHTHTLTNVFQKKKHPRAFILSAELMTARGHLCREFAGLQSLRINTRHNVDNESLC